MLFAIIQVNNFRLFDIFDSHKYLKPDDLILNHLMIICRFYGKLCYVACMLWLLLALKALDLVPIRLWVIASNYLMSLYSEPAVAGPSHDQLWLLNSWLALVGGRDVVLCGATRFLKTDFDRLKQITRTGNQSRSFLIVTATWPTPIRNFKKWHAIDEENSEFCLYPPLHPCFVIIFS